MLDIYLDASSQKNLSDLFVSLFCHGDLQLISIVLASEGLGRLAKTNKDFSGKSMLVLGCIITIYFGCYTVDKAKDNSTDPLNFVIVSIVLFGLAFLFSGCCVYVTETK